MTMNRAQSDADTHERLRRQNDELQRRLDEAQQTLDAIRHGDVDAIVVGGPRGEQVYSLTGAEHAYRLLVETMNEGALTVRTDGTVLYCNQRFCDLMRTPMPQVLGRDLETFAARAQRSALTRVLADAETGPVQRHLALRAADGTSVPVLMSANLLKGVDGLSICLVVSDLTALEESAHSIRALREHQQALQEANEQLSMQTEELQRSEQALIEAERKYRELVRYAPAGIYEIDFRSRRFTSVNDAMCHMLGYSEPELRALDPFEMLDEEARARIAACLGGHEPQANVEYRVKRKDGRFIDVVLDATFTRDENGQPLGATVVAHDITERKRAEAALGESERRFRTMADGLPLVIWVTDPEGGIEYVNRAYRDFFGVTEQQVYGSGWQPLVHPDDAPTYIGAFLDATRQRRHFRCEARVRRADGEWRWVDSFGDPYFSASRTFLGMVGGSPDITERRQAEEALRELNATLETKVAQRTSTLERRTRQLQQLALELSQTEQRERQRLAEILHDDLQQQLAAAKLQLGVVRKQRPDDARLQEGLVRIGEILEEAIAWSRSLSHELRPAILQHGTLGDALEWLAGQMHTRHALAVHVEICGKAEADSEALRPFLYRAAQELLFNAVKHAGVSEVRVRLRRCGRCLRLTVADAGSGFDPEHLRATKGFGLLSIRERIQSLGGRMKVSSAVGRGSTFVIKVADTAASAAQPGRGDDGWRELARPTGRDPHVREARRGPLRVLLVDDHRMLREGLAVLFNEQSGVEVVGQATNGREAVNLAYRVEPDVILMDVAMPVMNGYEAAEQIKRGLPQTRVVVLSMLQEQAAIERMRQAGAESYMLKTAPFEEILAAVRGRDSR